jgi:GNAT superfamily N-acetyltransferase
MLAPETRRRIDGYWAEFFGCTPDRLRPAEPVVLAPAAALPDYDGVYIQSFGAAPLISVPPTLPASIRDALARAAREGLEADARWADALGASFDRIVGPAWIGYADQQTLRAGAPTPGTRRLTEADRPLIEQLRDACTPTEWEHAGGDEGELAVGVFVDEELAALARYVAWGGGIAHVSIVTHPARRGRGHGREAVAALTREVLARGLVPQYRVLADNAPSLAVAGALGFQHYATSLALRLLPGR